MSYIHPTGLQRGNRELYVTFPTWPACRSRVSIGYLDSKRPLMRLTREEAEILLPLLHEMSKAPLPKAKHARLVAKIEGMTPGEIRQRLADNGINEGAGLPAYSKAKRVIFQGLWLDDSEVYDRHIEVIAEFLGI